jgi:hypothetical protein
MDRVDRTYRGEGVPLLFNRMNEIGRPMLTLAQLIDEDTLSFGGEPGLTTRILGLLEAMDAVAKQERAEQNGYLALVTTLFESMSTATVVSAEEVLFAMGQSVDRGELTRMGQTLSKAPWTRERRIRHGRTSYVIDRQRLSTEAIELGIDTEVAG